MKKGEGQEGSGTPPSGEHERGRAIVAMRNSYQILYYHVEGYDRHSVHTGPIRGLHAQVVRWTQGCSLTGIFLGRREDSAYIFLQPK